MIWLGLGGLQNAVRFDIDIHASKKCEHAEYSNWQVNMLPILDFLIADTLQVPIGAGKACSCHHNLNGYCVFAFQCQRVDDGPIYVVHCEQQVP